MNFTITFRMAEIAFLKVNIFSSDTVMLDQIYLWQVLINDQVGIDNNFSIMRKFD